MPCHRQSRDPQDPERERELGALLGDGVGEVFPVLVSYGKLITDYSADGAAAGAPRKHGCLSLTVTTHGYAATSKSRL